MKHTGLLPRLLWQLSALLLVLHFGQGATASETSMDQLKYDELLILNRNKVDFSPDTRYFAIRSQLYRKVELYELKTGTMLYAFNHKENISTCHFSADSKYLLTSSDDGEVKLIDVVNAKEKMSILTDSDSCNDWFSPQSRYLLIDDFDGELAIYHTETAQLIRMIRYASEPYSHHSVRSVVFFADGARALVTPVKYTDTGTEGPQGELRLSDGQILHHLRDINAIDNFILSPNGKYLALSPIKLGGRKSKKHIRLYETHDMKKFKTYKFKHNVTSVHFSENGSHLILKKDNDHIVLFNLSTKKQKTYQFDYYVNISPIKFSPDGKSFVLKQASDSYHLYHEEKRVATLKSTEHSPNFVFSPDGKLMLFYSTDKMLQLYDTRTGQLLREYAANDKFTFSPDSRYFAFTADRSEQYDEDFSDAESPDIQISVEIIRSADREHINSALFQGRVYQFLFSADSKSMITETDNIIRTTYLP